MKKEVIKLESGDGTICGTGRECLKTPEDGEFSEDVEFISRQDGVLTLKIDGVERQFFVYEEVVKYFSYSSSMAKAGDFLSRRAIVTEILSILHGDYGQEFEFWSKFKYFSGWCGLKYVRSIKEVKEWKNETTRNRMGQSGNARVQY